ncbi:MAG: hypothetical protein Q7T57_03250, partial [Dehalococcoidales bacterium]|nr:hypothetical protein [Dehalococcoidales bacterium]
MDIVCADGLIISGSTSVTLSSQASAFSTGLANLQFLNGFDLPAIGGSHSVTCTVTRASTTDSSYDFVNPTVQGGSGNTVNFFLLPRTIDLAQSGNIGAFNIYSLSQYSNFFISSYSQPNSGVPLTITCSGTFIAETIINVQISSGSQQTGVISLILP